MLYLDGTVGGALIEFNVYFKVKFEFQVKSVRQLSCLAVNEQWMQLAP